MGTYIQVGVCTEVKLHKAALAKVRLTREEAFRRLPGEFLDLSMFTESEDEEEIRWTLPAELIEEGLVPFLRAQYELFGRHAPKGAEATLARIAAAGSRDRILALAKTKSMPEFQMSNVGELLSLGLFRERLPLRASLLVYLVAGKAIVEDYGQLFGYVESLIHAQKGRFPIAAAVKVFLE